MSETCLLRQGERYEACDDVVVSKCALRDKKEGRSGFPERPVVVIVMPIVKSPPVFLAPSSPQRDRPFPK